MIISELCNVNVEGLINELFVLEDIGWHFQSLVLNNVVDLAAQFYYWHWSILYEMDIPHPVVLYLV